MEPHEGHKPLSKFWQRGQQKWTDWHTEELKRLWDSPLTVAKIGSALGVSGSLCSQKAKALGLPSRSERSKPCAYHRASQYAATSLVMRLRALLYSPYITEAARERNCKQSELVAKLLYIVVRDKMIDAIMDDEDVRMA